VNAAVMNRRMDKIVDDAAALVSPPDVWLQLNDVVNHPSAGAADIAEVIMCDPALTARLLRVANSPLYNFRTRIQTVSRAVAVLGNRELFALAAALAASDLLATLRCDLLSLDAYWKHSVAAAVMAQHIGRELRVLYPERLYVAGMLHDVGCLAFYVTEPERMDAAVDRAAGVESSLLEIERDVFGFDHTALGAALLTRWNLPVPLVRAVEYHYRPGEAGDSSFDAAVVHLATHAANANMLGLFVERYPDELGAPLQDAYDITGMNDRLLNELAKELDSELAFVLSIFEPTSESLV
jgi:HD-like signal output (HDOD) protein